MRFPFAVDDEEIPWAIMMTGAGRPSLSRITVTGVSPTLVCSIESPASDSDKRHSDINTAPAVIARKKIARKRIIAAALRGAIGSGF